MKPVRPLVLLLLLVALALGFRPLLAQRGQKPAAPVTRAAADRHFAEKSYALALPEYRALLRRTPPQAPDRALLEYRVAVALGASQRWDEALAAWDSFLPAHATDPLWSARGHYQRGLLRNQMPHQGYKVGARLYRGEDYPHTASAEKPEQVWAAAEDSQAELKDFEAAVKAYEALTTVPPLPGEPVTFTVRVAGREAGAGEPYRRLYGPRALTAEATDLYFDLAKFLPNVQGWGSKEDWKASKATDWAIRPNQPYNPKWPQPKKVLYLLARIPRLEGASDHNAVLAGLVRGLYVAQHHNGWARTERVTPLGKPAYWRVAQTIPYFRLDPMAVLTQTADQHPNDPQAPQIRLIVAQWAEQAGDFVGALKLYRALLARYPASKWVGDARQAADGIVRPQLGLSAPGPQRVDQKATITVGCRNVRTVTLRAYRIPLASVLGTPSKLENPDNRFTNFSANFGSLREARALGPRLAEWAYAPGDGGDHRPRQVTIPTPLAAPGAYLVEASGDDAQVRAATLVLITDLALMKKTDKDHVLCYVADARSGRPVPGASVLVRQIWYDSQAQKNKVQVGRGTTDADGMVGLPTVKGQENVQTEAFASAPGSRYALTGNGYWYDGGSGDTRDEIRVYAYTDRPVYRPRQTVYFRQLLARRAGGSEYAPLTRTPAHVTVTSPEGDTLYDKTLTSSQFGTVNGSFILPLGAPLGEYQLSVEVPGKADAATDGGSRFRVEEYKRPEYTVTVAPASTQARFGDAVTATVQADYYSGPPVAGAKVAYKVFRSPFSVSYRFPQPYDWYVHADDGDDESGDADQGELVTQGKGVTDARGALTVRFTADKGARGYKGDYVYTVKADVVDASRREISGEGVLHVTRQAFYAYLNVPNGFYQRGDAVQIELRTQNADEKPVPAAGTLTVYEQTYNGPKLIETAVHTEELATDADGKAFTTWRTDRSGPYRIGFKARDKFENPVVASAPAWVAGADLNARRFRVGGLTILTDKTTYEEGQTAHLLLVTDQPDNWVLLTSEAGNQVLTRSLVHVPGRARTLDVPIVRADVPNFAFAAAAVRDYQFYRWQQEVFVPPTRRFLHVAVSGDKAEYRPGDTGLFHVATTDSAGRPVSTEVSLAVIDSSVLYIQKEYAPDIRLFYYGQRRSINVSLDSSDSGQPEAVAESDLSVPRFHPHGLHLPETGRLPGDYYSADYAPFSYDGVHGRRFALQYNNSLSVGGLSISGYPGNGGGYPGGASFTVDGLADARRAGVSPMVPAHMMAARPKVAAPPPPQKPPPYAPAQVRRSFAETAFWTPAVVTSQADGTATVKVTFPDTLTTWKATARGLTAGVQVGAGDTQVVTNKHLLVRLEAPRFFVERDRVTLSAIVRNDLATDKQVRVSLALGGGVLALQNPPPVQAPTPPETGGAGVGPAALASSSSRFGRSTREVTRDEAGEVGSVITVLAHGERRVDWSAQVVGDGTATIRMTAQTDEESDAVEQTFPALAYGVQKFLTTSGVLQRGQSKASLTITLPRERKAGSAALLVQVNPSLAATTLDALPYLADYPYGCVEQTMSRFLPSVVVAKTLREAGVNLDTLHKRALAMAERAQAGTPFGQAQATGLDTDQTGYTYPTGTPGVLKTPQLTEGLAHGDRWTNPVFDPERLKGMVDEGLGRLVGMQRGDGGWGWWGGSAESDPYMSAYVVYGLATAKQAGVAVPTDVLARGYAYLAADIKDRDDERDLAVWEAFALSQNPAGFPASGRRVVHAAYAKRDRLSAYGQALLALTLHNLGENAQAAVVCRNLRNTATVDAENGTASWKGTHGDWWDWYNNDVETDAWALKAYVAVLPHDDLTPMLVKWLVQNRRGSQWRSTKETAMAVYGLTDYLKASNELAPDYTVTVALGDKLRRTFTVNRDNALLFDNRFLVPDTLLADGPQTVTVTKSGAGRLYYSTALQYVTTEENIAASGTELKVQRRYYRLTPKSKTVADDDGGAFNVLDYTRTALPDGAALHSGDLIDVELVLDSKNEYDYCCFEDRKPAGCEPLDLRSGEQYGDGLCSNMELRDTKTAFFVDHLPQGTRVLRYRLRAEVPGAFHALPANGYAMYAPDVRALSDGWHVTVSDEQAARR